MVSTYGDEREGVRWPAYGIDERGLIRPPKREFVDTMHMTRILRFFWSNRDPHAGGRAQVEASNALAPGPVPPSACWKAIGAS